MALTLVISDGMTRAICSAVTAVVASAAVISISAPASADGATPPEGSVVVELVTVNGSGCPTGTSTVQQAPDNTAFRVTHSDYLARVGPGARPTDFRKSCQLSVMIRVPDGYQYAIAKVEYLGQAHVVSGASGVLRATYYAAGSSTVPSVSHALFGPYSDFWQVTVAPAVPAVYTPCRKQEQRLLNLNTDLRVRAGTSDPAATTFMSMGGEGGVGAVYHYAWRRCPL